MNYKLDKSYKGQSDEPATNSSLISERIIEIAKRGASVAAKTNIFKASRDYQLPLDLGNIPATVYDEGLNITNNQDPNFARILMQQKKMGSYIEVSQKVANMAYQPQFDNHIHYLLTNRIMLGIEDQMFYSGTAEGLSFREDNPETSALQNIFLYNNLDVSKKINGESIKEVGTSTVALTYDALLEAYLELTSQFENNEGLVWVVTDAKKLAYIKDTDGKSVLTPDNKAPGGVGYVLGVPVFKTAKFSSTTAEGVLINPERAYAVSIAPEAKVKEIGNGDGDGYTAMRSSKLYIGETYVDGKVMNPRAIVILNGNTPVTAFGAENVEEVENPVATAKTTRKK